MPAGVVAGVTSVFTAAGVGAATAGILADAVIGAGLGAGVSAIEGGNVGLGALTGGLTGGALGFAPGVAAELGISTTAADIGLGAAAGAAGSAITGQSVGKGALFGGIEGGVAAALNPSASAPAGSAGGASGGGTAAATASQLGGSPDLTSQLTTTQLGGAAPTAVQPFTDPVYSSGAPAIGSLEVTTPSVSGLPSGVSGVAGAGAFSGSLTGSDNNQAGSAPITPVTSQPLGGQTGGIGFGTDNLSTPTVGTKGIATPGNAGASGSSFSQFAADPSLKTASGLLTSNPGTVLGALGLGYQALTAPSLPSESGLVSGLKTQADRMASQGNILQSYITNGQLPPGAMAAVNSATASAKATLKSQYAAMGLSGSTSEATALADVDQRAAGQIFQIADTLLQQGITESGLSVDIYKSILSETNAQNQIMASAISNFATSIAGGGSKGVTLNLAGAQAA